MTLPFFGAGDDPGPSFIDVLKRSGGEPRWADLPRQITPAEVAHGTTVVAVRFADGVVMSGDRRVTAGNLISHRTAEKVLPADRHSGVAIAGAAGPALEMVKLFQLQLEHYEKVEGAELSLEGKANQLAQMVRGHLPAAMQGFVVVPLFAGYDTTRGRGRLFEYDVTGGRYEESDFAATGSGRLHAGPRPADRRRSGHQRPVPGGRRGLGHRGARPRAGHLPGGGDHHVRGVPAARRRGGGRALQGVARAPLHRARHHRRSVAGDGWGAARRG